MQDNAENCSSHCIWEMKIDACQRTIFQHKANAAMCHECDTVHDAMYVKYVPVLTLVTEGRSWAASWTILYNCLYIKWLVHQAIWCKYFSSQSLNVILWEQLFSISSLLSQKVSQSKPDESMPNWIFLYLYALYAYYTKYALYIYSMYNMALTC